MICIINPNLDAESLNEVVAKLSDIITKLKGFVLKINEWGKKKLAYEIKQFDKGHYVLFDFCGNPDTVDTLERSLKLDERVLKYITVKIDDDADPEELMREERKQEIVAEERHNQAIEEE
jgi:small subunit ribosomal protein S6